MLPNERKTYEVCTETANVFSIRVWSGGLRTTADLAPFIGWGKRREAVWPAECPKVGHDTLAPKKRVRILVSRQARKTGHQAFVVVAQSHAKTSAQRP